MKFSLLTNSRARVPLLYNCLKSIQDTTNDISNIEMFICIDANDNESISVVKEIEKEFNFVRFAVCSPYTTNLHVNLNNLIQYCSGKYIFGLNDDCVILTKNWDILSFEKLERHQEIIYGNTGDNSFDKIWDKNYASFPILSKKAIEKLGYFLPEKFTAWGADVYLYRLFKSAGENFICSLKEELYLDHVKHSSIEAYMNRDDTQKNMEKFSNFFNINPLTCDIQNDYYRLIN